MITDRDLSSDSTRRTKRHHVSGNIMGNRTAGTDDRMLTNRNATLNKTIGTNPDVVANRDRGASHHALLATVVVNRVTGASQTDVRTDHHALSERHR